MRKALLLVLLGAGSALGFAHGFHTVRHHGCWRGDAGDWRGDSHAGAWHAPWAQSEAERTERFAEACASAARGVQAPAPATPAATPP
jgi:hypothetical protein